MGVSQLKVHLLCHDYCKHKLVLLSAIARTLNCSYVTLAANLRTVSGGSNVPTAPGVRGVYIIFLQALTIIMIIIITREGEKTLLKATKADHGLKLGGPQDG
jgi:hypothetical protein